MSIETVTYPPGYHVPGRWQQDCLVATETQLDRAMAYEALVRAVHQLPDYQRIGEGDAAAAWARNALDAWCAVP